MPFFVAKMKNKLSETVMASKHFNNRGTEIPRPRKMSGAHPSPSPHNPTQNAGKCPLQGLWTLIMPPNAPLNLKSIVTIAKQIVIIHIATGVASSLLRRWVLNNYKIMDGDD
ncbi:hypothetical protein GPALN_011492 [Globodera pallida]|nr:hypothetical protein GPALN_011492 [Globodera pallida]